MSRLAAAAARYAQAGWPVFPLKPGEKVPATRHGVKDATCDPEQIARWWERTPDANIGLACGEPSGVWVVDIDGDEGMNGFCELGHGIPPTLTSATPSGGWHLLFEHPAGLGNTASKIASKVDTRGAGGYIVLPPSVHPNGGRYAWVAKAKPEPVPGWLIRLVRQPPPERPKRRLSGDTGNYASAACEAEAEMVATAVEGTRNDTLNRAGFALGTLVGAGMVDRQHAYDILEDAGQAAGLTSREIRSTLDRALDDGAKHPREVT